MKIAKRAEILEPSALQEFFKKTKESRDIISFAVGETNFCTPAYIKKVAKEAIDLDRTKYTPAAGMQELRELAVIDFSEDKIEAKKESTVISAGSKPLISAVIWALCDPGDEILIPGPYYPPYWDLVLTYGGKPVLVDTAQDGFELKGSRIKKCLSEKAKAIILNSPNNPTGMVWDWQELKDLPSDIWIIVDEAYYKIVYGSYQSFVSVFPERAKQTITIRSLSKTFAMTGWRIGYLTGPEQIVKKIQLYLEVAVGSPCSISQGAAAEALRGLAFTESEKMVRELNLRREFLMKWLDERKVKYPKPEGAFYVFADFSRWGDCLSLSNRLLEKAKVAVTPGIAFGPYKDYIRLSYAAPKSFEEFQEGLERMDKILK